MDWNDEKMDSTIPKKECGCDRDFSVRGMLATAYSPKLRGVMVVAWANMIIFLAIMVWSIAVFAKTQDVKTMILSATGFTMCMVFIGVVKLWVCQNILLANLKRHIARLEQKIDAHTAAGGK